MLPSKVRLVEVGPRDGLQNEPETIPVQAKLAFVRSLAEAGFPEVEATSFVHPRWVPQLADAEELSRALVPDVRFTALVPNQKGLERALACGYRRVAIFTAASESFSRKNTNRSIRESLQEFPELVARARRAGASVRGYVSTAFYCPFEGAVAPQAVLEVTRELLDMGVDEVSLGDTIGAAVPKDVQVTLGVLLERLSSRSLALHFHDTSGTALANVLAGLQLGITCYDCSAGGLGGCPYAPGATGNLASEDLLYMLARMGIETGVDLVAVARASLELSRALGRELPGRQLKRLVSRDFQVDPGPGASRENP